MTKRVTEIGGIFFKSEDPEKLRAWYGEQLGFHITQWGRPFNGLTLINGTLIIWQGRSGVRSQHTTHTTDQE